MRERRMDMQVSPIFPIGTATRKRPPFGTERLDRLMNCLQLFGFELGKSIALGRGTEE